MKHHEILQKYLKSSTAVSFVSRLMEVVPNVQLKIVSPRVSKYGTMSYQIHRKMYVISINNNLNPAFFLFVFLHEYAHVLTHLEVGRVAKPHGKEWQLFFFELIKSAIRLKLFDNKISRLIQEEILVPNVYLRQRYLKVERTINGQMDKQTLMNLSVGQSFVFKGKTFVIEKKLRTNYLCRDKKSGALYKVSGYLILD